MFLQKLSEAEEMRDQAGHSLSCTEQTIDPLQTVSAALSISFVQFVMRSGLRCWIIPLPFITGAVKPCNRRRKHTAFQNNLPW